MKVSFEGVGEQVLSFNKASGVTKGALVKMSANSTVKACDAGDRFMGVCIASGDAFAEVKTAGYVELGYSGTAPAVGYAKLVGAWKLHRSVHRGRAAQGNVRRKGRACALV